MAPDGTLTWVLTFSDSTHPVLRLITCTGVYHLLLYLSSIFTHTLCEVLFLPRLTFLSVSPVFLWSFCVWPWIVWRLLILCRLPLWSCFLELCFAACPDSCPVLFLSLFCLWYTCRCHFTIACLTLIKIIKEYLQMDPHASDSSLQKTSPFTDPAAIYQLTSEVSAQATMLTSHQQQLQRLTSITEELVKCHHFS